MKRIQFEIEALDEGHIIYAAGKRYACGPEDDLGDVINILVAKLHVLPTIQDKKK